MLTSMTAMMIYVKLAWVTTVISMTPSVTMVVNMMTTRTMGLHWR